MAEEIQMSDPEMEARIHLRSIQNKYGHKLTPTQTVLIGNKWERLIKQNNPAELLKFTIQLDQVLGSLYKPRKNGG